MAESVSDFLSEKLSEYRILSAPLNRAAEEMDYAKKLVKARVESDIAETVPVLGALADILDISIIDLLMSADRRIFLENAMQENGISSDELMHQLRSLAPPSREELNALGLDQ